MSRLIFSISNNKNQIEFLQKVSQHFMWIVDLADDSHKISIYFLWKIKNNLECRLLQILLGAPWVTTLTVL